MCDFEGAFSLWRARYDGYSVVVVDGVVVVLVQREQMCHLYPTNTAPDRHSLKSLEWREAHAEGAGPYPFEGNKRATYICDVRFLLNILLPVFLQHSNVSRLPSSSLVRRREKLQLQNGGFGCECGGGKADQEFFGPKNQFSARANGSIRLEFPGTENKCVECGGE